MKPKILQAIREANPELMELSAGCEFIEQFGQKALVLRKYIVSNESDVYDYTYDKPNAEDLGFARSPHHPAWKIIGHPPELRHLLRAIAKEPSDYEMWLDATTFDTPHLLATKYGEREDFEKPMFSYDLTKSLSDNLDDEELCAFLFDLLVKE